MRVVEIRLPLASFATALGEMRSWLDHHHCDTVKFESATEAPATVRIRVEFPFEDALAAAFRQRFDAGTTEDTAAAA